MHLVSLDFGNAQYDAAIIQHQGYAGSHIIRQFFVIQPHLFLITQFALGIEYEFVTGFQRDFPMLEFADTDFRSLQICQYAYSLTGGTGQRTS